MKRLFSSLLLITLVISMLLMTSCNASDVKDIISNTKTQLATPTNLRVDEDNATLMWNSVEYASGYTVLVNETTYSTSTNSLSLQSLKSGEHTLSVMANGDGIMYSSSAYSGTIRYTRKASNGNEYSDEVIAAFREFDEINTKNSFLGYGIDIINASAITSKNVLMTYPIFDMDKLMNENLLKSNEHYNSFESIEAMTIEEFSRNMSTSNSITSGANVSAKGNILGIGASASASLSSGLTTSFTKTSDLVESQYFLEIIAENQSYWLILQTSEQKYKDLLSEEFKEDLYNVSITPAQLFAKYGTHMLTSVAMGGNICMYYTMYSYNKNVSASKYAEVSSTLKTNVEAAYGGYSAGAGTENSFNSAFTYETLAHNYGIQIDKKIVSAGGGSFGINNETTLYENYYDWQKSLDTYPVVIGIKDTNSLYPIWNLLDLNIEGAAERYNELYNYFQSYGAESYNTLCETYSITPSVAPTGITNIKVGAHSNYSENQVVNVKSGETLQITFDVEPHNANKYLKTFSVDNATLASVDNTGLVTIAPTTPGGSYIRVTVTAGSISKQVTLYVINTYNVTFNTRVSGLEVAPLYGILEGYSIDEPKISREGYILEGWYTDAANSNKFDFESDCVISHMTLYAKWVAIKPVVTFDTGNGSKVDSQTLAYNATATKPQNPTLTGYTFDGWFIDKECTEVFDFSTTIVGDITLYAKWDKIEYTVTFESNGGTPLASVTTSITEDYKISEIAPIRSYYVFDGWYTDSYLTQKFYFETEISKDITLYAKWTPEQSYVTLVDTDGVSTLYDIFGNEIKTLTTNIDNSFRVTAPTPYKAGHTFEGWYLNGIKIDLNTYSEFKPKEEPYKVVALWSVNSYTVTYIINGEKYDTKTYKYGEKITLPTVNVVGNDFSGWKWGNKEIPTTMPAENIELTGALTVLNYTVTYYVDGVFYKTETYDYGEKIDYIAEPTESGKAFSGWTYLGGALPATMPAGNIRIDGGFNIVERTVYYYIDGKLNKSTTVIWCYEIPEYSPEKIGYTFSGWTLENGDPMPEVMPNNDVYAYGSFSINSYTITFNTAGGSEIAPITAEYGSVITKPADPTRMGYTFAGWDKEIPSTMPAENVTINASWSINTYTITFNTNGGSSVTEISAPYGTAISVPANPTKTGNDFAGWDKEIPETMPAYNMTVYAAWDIHVHTLTFISNGTVVAKINGDYGSSVTAPADPTRTGYTFGGWDKTIPTTMPDEDITFTAKWTLYVSEITYNINSDTTVDNQATKGKFALSGSISSISYNVTQLNDADATTYSGYYNFLGWFTAPSGGTQITDGNGKLLANVVGYTNAEGKWIRESFDSLTLYAQWKQVYDGTYIEDEAGLKSIGSNGNYYIITDIIFSSAWTPIASFNGTIDGLGHTITGLSYSEGTISGDRVVGFVGTLNSNGIIRDLNFEGATIHIGDSSSNHRQALMGVACGENYGTIEKVKVYNSSVTVSLGGTDYDKNYYTYVGLIVGKNHNKINDCHVYTSKTYGDPHTKGKSAKAYVGGIVGVTESGSTISNCSVNNCSQIAAQCIGCYSSNIFSGYWSAQLDAYAGGIVGVANSATITNCTVTGNTVTATVKNAASDCQRSARGDICGKNNSSTIN